MSDFHTYSEKHCEYFKSHGRVSVYKKGQLLVKREEPSPWMFFLETGYVKMVFTNDSFEERILGFGMPGMVFTQSGTFYTSPHTELEYEAYTDCVVWRVDRTKFMRDLKTDPNIFLDWYDRILQNHNMLIERVLYLGERDPNVRFISWLLGMTRYYSLAQKNGSVLIEIPMTQDVMANFAHLSRESVNKVLKDLKSKGLVEIQNKFVTVPSVQALNDELSIIQKR